MEKVTLKEAFAQEKLDPKKIKIEGVPERHVEALKAVAELFVMHDAVNPKFQPDYDNFAQDKWENCFTPGSPSGGGFSFIAAVDWSAYSDVGARLVSESDEAAKHIASECEDQYKKLMVYQRPTAKE